MGRKLKDKTGMRFGHLTVVALASFRTPGRCSVYLCRCDCGTEWYVSSGNLHRNGTQSCGCEKKEARKK